MKKVILHIDMDAFFAAIEQTDDPCYAHKPLVVGADPKHGEGRGVVSTASYEARQYGIKSAMPISQAYRLCPHAIFLRPRMKRYEHISNVIMDIFYQFSPKVEQISIDEAFLDCTGCEKLFGRPRKIAQQIKDEIYKQTALTASIGIATNKSIAKIASDLQKPDGITICPEGQERKFLAPLAISHLWGAGKRTIQVLQSFGFKTIGDLATRTQQEMESILGKWGEHLWLLSQGIDSRAVTDEATLRKSISKEHTFSTDTDNIDHIETIILHMCDHITRKLRFYSLQGKTIILKIRFHDFTTHTKSYTFMEYLNTLKPVCQTAMTLLHSFDLIEKKIRLIGITISNIIDKQTTEKQLQLFTDDSRLYNESDKDIQKEIVLDRLKRKYGTKITRASLLNLE